MESCSEYFVYRVLRSEEMAQNKIIAKDPDGKKTVRAHIMNGSRGWYKSQYVSCTRSLDVAQKYAKKTGSRIAKINISNFLMYWPEDPDEALLQKDLQPNTTKFIDLTDDELRKHICREACTCNNFARSSKEVLLVSNTTIPFEYVLEPNDIIGIAINVVVVLIYIIIFSLIVGHTPIIPNSSNALLMMGCTHAPFTYF